MPQRRKKEENDSVNDLILICYYVAGASGRQETRRKEEGGGIYSHSSVACCSGGTILLSQPVCTPSAPFYLYSHCYSVVQCHNLGEEAILMAQPPLEGLLKFMQKRRRAEKRGADNQP